MVKTFKGFEVDMSSLAIKHKNTIALGNAKMDSEGNVYENGKMVKTRAELLEEAKLATVTQSGNVNLKPEIKDEIIEEEIKIAKPTKKPVYKDITEEEKKELEKAKEQ